MIGEHLGSGSSSASSAVAAWARSTSGAKTSGDLAALKILMPDLSHEPGFLERFRREIIAISALDHPNIVKFFEAGESERRLFYAMEYVQGEDFEVILTRFGRRRGKKSSTSHCKLRRPSSTRTTGASSIAISNRTISCAAMPARSSSPISASPRSLPRGNSLAQGASSEPPTTFRLNRPWASKQPSGVISIRLAWSFTAC